MCSLCLILKDNNGNSMNSELIKFIVKHTDLKVDDIKPELRLAQDIGFYGLDSISFFEIKMPFTKIDE